MRIGGFQSSPDPPRLAGGEVLNSLDAAGSLEVPGLGPWRITRTLARDLSGVYYSGRRDDGEQATLYLLSGDRTSGADARLTALLALHREVDHPGLIPFRGVGHDGGDRYLIADPIDDALAPLRGGCRPAVGQVGPFGAALADALAAAHERDLLHGALTLDNVRWAPYRTPQILGTGVSALGAVDAAALARGDVAALGRLLCALIAGWPSLGADGAGQPAAARGRLGAVVRRLADPREVITMREAHAMLAEGDPTQTVHIAAGDPLAVVDPLGISDALAAADRPPSPDTEASPGRAPGDSAALAGHVGRYRILTRLGRGGMGEVFLAEDPALRRGVAIKRIRPGLEHDRTFRARLRREARLAAHLNHRAIVQVFDLVNDDSADHVVMEYVPGPSLHTLVGSSRPPFSAVVRIASEIAEGLAYAHHDGVIHRDLKLENILIGANHQPKI